MRYITLYLRYIGLALKSRMEYRFSFFMDMLTPIFRFSLTYAGLWVLFAKFNKIQGWSYYEVMFLFTLNLFTYGICGMFFWSPMMRLEYMVRQGAFDSLLTRPITAFWHLIFREYNHVFFGHMILSFIMFRTALIHLDIDWSFQKVFLLIALILGGVLIQAGILVTGGSLCFWFVRSGSAAEMTTENLRSFIDYPITIYVGWVQAILTFVIPYAFVNFYPSLWFLGKEGAGVFQPILQVGTPVVGVLVCLGAWAVWRSGVRRYQSTGS